MNDPHMAIGQIGRSVALYLIEAEYGEDTAEYEARVREAHHGGLVPVHVGRYTRAQVYHDPEFGSWFLWRDN